MMADTTVTLTVELDANAAAALYRLVDKLGHSDAMAYLYPHLPRELRSEQVGQMIRACYAVQKALGDAGVSAWPWIETGDAT